MSNDTKTYNGWTNYETWCVYLWSTNEQTTYEFIRDEARRYRREAPSHPNVSEGIWTAREAARFTLAESLKTAYETYHPFRGEFLAKPMEPDVYCDLLDAALSEVRWSEIAEAFLEEFEPETDPDKGSDTTEKKEHQYEEPKEPRFPLGQVVSTPRALEALGPEEMAKALARHHAGDWGDIDPDDWQDNETSLREGFRLFSVYRSENGVRFWVITEADRSATNVLLPDEY